MYLTKDRSRIKCLQIDSKKKINLKTSKRLEQTLDKRSYKNEQ